MKKNILSYGIPLFTFLVIILLASCTKEVNRLPFQADELFTAEEKAVLSKELAIEKFNYIRNVTKEDQYKVFLGRVLFYDNQLSADRSVSCESCHKQELAFSDNVAFSRGVAGNTARNSIALASFSSFEGHYGGEEPTDVAENSFFWDGRADRISAQLSETFANPNEMGMKLHELGSRVGSLDYAKLLYEKAFPGQSLKSENVIAAIAAFVNDIESNQALFDKGLGQTQFDVEEPFELFSETQNNGKQLFLTNCASCHAFSLSDGLRHKFGNRDNLASNGLDMEYLDNGLGQHTSLVEDNGIFKIPGIRNIALTGPYMHDGRFESLEDVVDFYSENIQAHPNLSEKLKDEEGNPKRMNFNDTEKADLVAFLETLTGETHMTDINLSTPFK